MKFLLIDDDQLFLFLYKRLIASSIENPEIIEYQNGDDGIQYIKSCLQSGTELPDIIFLDINMPVLDGWGFLQEYALIKEQINQNIPIYMLSSSISPQDVFRAENHDLVTDFLFKPLNKSIIESIVYKLSA